MRSSLLCSFSLFIGALLVLRVAAAEPPKEDDALPTFEDPRKLELDPASSPPSSFFLTLEGALRLTDAGTRATGLLILGGDLDDIQKPSSRRASAESAKEAPVEKRSAEPAPAEKKADKPKEDPRLRAFDAVPSRGALVRGALKAAIKASGDREVRSRLDDASTRARVSGLVPELRLRIAHVMDEGQSLMPTEYDPERVTATGGTSLWLEGRATFRLDRLVFADEEVAIERLRNEHAKAVRDLTDDVLKAFGDWQRATAVLALEDVEQEVRDRAEVEAAVAEARLDALTDGWFEPAARAALAREQRTKASCSVER